MRALIVQFGSPRALNTRQYLALMPTPSTPLERGISILFVGVVVVASLVGPWWVAPVGFIALGVAYGFPDGTLTFALVLAACIALAMVLAAGLILLIGS